MRSPSTTRTKCIPMPPIDGGNSRHRNKKRSARLESPGELRQRPSHVEDQMEGLREDDAIKRPFRQSSWDRDIADDGGDEVRRVDMENIALLDLLAAEAERILIVADFEDPATDPGSVAG